MGRGGKLFFLFHNHLKVIIRQPSFKDQERVLLYGKKVKYKGRDQAFQGLFVTELSCVFRTNF